LADAVGAVATCRVDLGEVVPIPTLPDAIIKFFPEATVVSPFKLTAPVPVPNVVAPDWLKLPLADRVVKAPVFAVVEPIVPGVAHGTDPDGNEPAAVTLPEESIENFDTPLI
jgi:hypothetical protein